MKDDQGHATQDAFSKETLRERQRVEEAGVFAGGYILILGFFGICIAIGFALSAWVI